jgi:putative redox protein
MVLDGDSKEGPSPTEALLVSLAVCMGIDVREILEKSRVTFSGIEIEVEGDRAAEPPRRFLSLRIEVRVKGPQEADLAKVERATELSRSKYCSVFHTLQPDLDVRLSTSIV